MKIKQLNEKHSKLVNKFQNKLEKGDASQKEMNNLKADIKDVSNKLDNAKFKDEQIKKRLDKQVNQENSNDNKIDSKMSENSKIYNTADSIYQGADNQRDDIHINDYMRAVMDKPQTAQEQIAISNSVTSSGYELPETVSSQLLDKLREENPLVKAGAMSTTVAGDKQSWVKIKNNPTSNWHAELNEEDSDNTDIFDSVKMDPKTLLSVVEISRETLQDSVNAGEALTVALSGALNDRLIESSFTSQGADAPKGLNDLVSQTEQFDNGKNATIANMVRANGKLYSSNVSEDNRSFMYSPEVWENLSLETDDNGRYQMVPESIKDIQKYTSSGVPTGEAYVADFSNFIYGFSLDITLEQFNGGSSANKYGSKFLAAMRVDCNVTHPNAFVRVEETAQ